MTEYLTELLMDDRQQRLQHLEDVIELHIDSFLRVGSALLEIREKGLYEDAGCGTFTEYLQERFPAYTRAHHYRLMDATEIHGYLEDNVSSGDMLPKTEGAMRELTRLGTPSQVKKGGADPELWVRAWERACKLAKLQGVYPQDRHVRQACIELKKGAIYDSMPLAEPWDGSWELGKVHLADITDTGIYDHIPKGQVDLIITDPPWGVDPDGGFLFYEALGRFAVHVLKEGGVCVTYLGKTHLPTVVGIMDSWLDYEWLFAVSQPEGTIQMRITQFYDAWRPVGIWRKAGNKFPTLYCPDMIQSTRDKSLHEWQQGVEPVQLLMNKYSAEGMVVCDPFMGSGTTGWVAAHLKRQWVGFDVDPVAVNTAMERIHGRA